MHRIKTILLLLALLLPFTASATEHDAPSKPGELDMESYIFGHIGDAYEWHITTVNGHHISIPLPCIVIDDGLHVFLSNHIEESGYTLNENGKLVNAATGKRPVDLSITKNACSLILSSILLLVMVLGTARWYKRHDVLKEAPRGFPGLMEMLITMVVDDIIKEGVGEDYERYAPYLLTAFFFIFLNNLLGIVPFFPGGANLTGNIAVTLFLAMCTFLAVNLFGNKHYYKDIFWPEVPTWLKVPVPLMPLIEIIGMFTKPFSLMVRLFANILAGHIMLLGVVAVIFLTAELGPALNGSMTVISVLFGVFMDILELLVAFIQAYVFTMLSSVFIGLSRQKPEHEKQLETSK
ncbi:MAG: F0F1 ATP synthase subunit A [Bacteroidales bacterium]|nr:F0F1 ATP synthase subunit A [Bacteroidales bacterium]